MRETKRGGHNRVHWAPDRRRSTDTIPKLKRAIVGDSLERKRLVEKLIKMVREDERSKG